MGDHEIPSRIKGAITEAGEAGVGVEAVGGGRPEDGAEADEDGEGGEHRAGVARGLRRGGRMNIVDGMATTDHDFPIPGAPDFCASTPDAAATMRVLGSGPSLDGVRFTRDEWKALLKFYGYSHEETRRQVDEARRVHGEAVAKYETERAKPPSFSAPRPVEPRPFKPEEVERFYEAGAAVNIGHHVTRDGLRVMALLGPFLERGEDPVRLVARLMVMAGYDVQVSMDWIDGVEEDGEDEGSDG